MAMIRQLPILATWIAVAGTLTGNLSHPAATTYQLFLSSRVELMGQTNVSQFSCAYSEGQSQQQVSLSPGREGEPIALTHPTLRIPVPQLDCGNALMNKDLQEALQAEDYPFIRVKVAEVILPNACELGKSARCLTGRARVTIFIAEARQSLEVPIEARCEQQGQLLITGVVPLRMSHFGITPPTAMFGMIEVEDAIRVKVQLTASWQKV